MSAIDHAELKKIDTVPMARDLKRLSRGTYSGPRARTVETLCSVFERELRRRAEKAMREVES